MKNLITEQRDGRSRRSGLIWHRATVAWCCWVVWGGLELARAAVLPLPVSFTYTSNGPLIGEEEGGGRHGFGFPDPKVFRDGEDFYITGTSLRFYRTRSFQKNDLTRYDLKLDFGSEASRVQKIWSASLYRHTDGTYHLYATLNYGEFETSVGHFVPQSGEVWRKQSPIKRWRLARVLVPNAYDATAFRDGDGTLYLIYDGSRKPKDGRHFMAWRMRDPGTMDTGFQPRAFFSSGAFRSENLDRPGGGRLVEAATISRIQGKYVMLYSVGDFNAANYKLGVAFSDTLIPTEGKTYQRIFAPDPTNIWGSGRGKEVLYLLQTQKPGWPNYWGRYLQAPGSGNLVERLGQLLLVFHARHPGEINVNSFPRCTWTMPVQVNIVSGVPPEQWIRIPVPAVK